MKILMTLMGLDIGGAETHVAELAKSLARRGHTVILASNGGTFVPLLEAEGIRHVTVPMNQRSLPKMLRSLRLLKHLIREERPDIVHAHARIPAFLCGILQRTMDFPLITTAHWVFEVTPLLRLMTDWGDRTVAVSPDIREYLMENYQIPSDRIDLTINGINTQSYCPGPRDERLRAELGLKAGPVVGLVSRLDQTRGRAAELLIQTVPALERAFPHVQVCIVGDGNSIRGGQEMERKLRADAAAVNTALGRQAVVMTGAREDVPQLLDQMDVFVGVSRAALEAMSAAKPVILAGNEGYLGLLTPEALSDARESNFCCRGCPAATEEALLADLCRVLSLPEDQREALGAYGRRVVEAEYSVQRMTEDYLASYEALLHPAPQATAVISGYYGYDNQGDEAILWAIHRQLAALRPQVRLVVLSRRPRETAGRLGLRAVGRFSPVGVLRALRRCDVLISGGGSLLQDRTSTRSVRYYLWVIHMAQKMGKPVFLWANGIGPLTRPSNRKRVCRTLETCSRITLRDEDSLHFLGELGLRRTDIQVTGDPALLLDRCPEAEARAFLSGLGIPADRPMVALSVRQAPGLDPARFAALGDKIVRELGRTVVFLPMQEPEDRELSLDIQRRMEENSFLLPPLRQPERMLGVIGCMDAVLSLRLHTMIFAAKVRVPFVGCVYDPKVEAFLKLMEMPSCGTPREMTAGGALAALRDLLDRRPEAEARLEERVRPMEGRAGETVRLFAGLMEDRD